MLETDLLLDRRRLKRRLNFWRVAAVLAVVAALASLAVPGVRSGGRHIARVNVTGIITENQQLNDSVLALAKDRSVPAVIVSIDSPGGSVAGGESLPTPCCCGWPQPSRSSPSCAAPPPRPATWSPSRRSASSPATRTLTGSIGVILQTGEVSGLLGHLGITAEAITSGPLKGAAQLHPPDDAERAANTSAAWSRTCTTNSSAWSPRRGAWTWMRSRSWPTAAPIPGARPRSLGLIDEIGGEVEARDWLAEKHGIADTTPVRDLKPGGFYQRTFGAALTGCSALLLGDADGRRLGYLARRSNTLP